MFSIRPKHFWAYCKIGLPGYQHYSKLNVAIFIIIFFVTTCFVLSSTVS